MSASQWGPVFAFTCALILGPGAQPAWSGQGAWTEWHGTCGGNGCSSAEESCISAASNWYPTDREEKVLDCVLTGPAEGVAHIVGACCGAVYQADIALTCPIGTQPDPDGYGTCRPDGIDQITCDLESTGAGEPNCLVRKGNPIYIEQGAKSESVVDFTTGGPDPLVFSRSYNSLARTQLSSFSMPLGRRWQSNFDRYLRQTGPNTTVAYRSSGSAVQFTARGGESALFDDSSTSFVSAADSADWNFGAGQFTVEARVRFSSLGTYSGLIHQSDFGSNQVSWVIDWTTGHQIRFLYSPDGTNASRVTLAAPWTPNIDVWHHIAVDRDSNQRLRVYVDGDVLIDTVVPTTIHNSTAMLKIGPAHDGWIDEVRITKGTAQYGGAYLPPVELSSSGNVVLLTHLNGADGATTAIDDSSRNHTLSFAGNARIDATQGFSHGQWDAAANLPLQLVQTATGWELRDLRDTVETYDSGLRLTEVRRRNGYAETLTYNASGQLATVTDSYGRRLTFTYQQGRLSTMTAPDGGVYRYYYDTPSGLNLPKLNRLIGVSYPDHGAAWPPQVQYLYERPDLPGFLTGIIDENGDRYATWDYDTDGRATMSEHAGAVDRVQIGYSPDGSRTVTNPLGQQTIYRYADVAGRSHITSVERFANPTVPAATETRAYGPDGHIDSWTQFDGTVTTYVHDARGLQTSRTHAVGTPQERTIVTVWHPDFRVPTQIVAPNVTTDFTHDTNGLVLTRTETDTTTHSAPYATNGRTRTWTYTYNAQGVVETVDGPRTAVTDVTTYAYTPDGYLSRVTNALGQFTEVTAHTARGLPATVTDANSVVTDLAYDLRGRLVSRTVRDPGGDPDRDATTRFVYDGVGQVTEIVRPDGSILRYEYDAAHRLTAVANGLGERIEYTLDSMGNRTAEVVKSDTAAIVRTQTAVFDDLGRLLQSLGAAFQTTQYAYDNDSNMETITDPLGRVTGQAFDALNRLVAITDAATPTAGLTTYGYDAADNLISVTDPRGLQTLYTVDGFGYRIRTDSPDTGITDDEYDPAGNMTRRTDARGVVTDYTYDALNRPTAQTYPAAPAENVSWTYDDPTPGVNGIGRLTGITDESGSTAIAYDHRGSVAQETRTIGGVAYTTAYAYDLADNLKAITYPSGRVVTYWRDREGRAFSVTTRATALSADYAIAWNMTYRPFGALERLTFGNGLDVELDYDLDGRLTDIETGPSGALPNVQDLTYTYDDANNILTIADALDLTRDQGFGYDRLDRLTSATGLYGTIGYDYDPVGNRTLRTIDDGLTITGEIASHDVFSNRLEEVAVLGTPVRDLTHSASGQITTDDRDGVVYDYGYDKSDRLTSVTVGGVATAGYVHNALGQRVVKDVGGVVTHFHYDRAGRLIAETAPDGLGGFTLVKEYVDVDGLPLALIEPGSGSGTATELSVDNQAAEASSTGIWAADTAATGHLGGDYRVRRGGDGSESFTWAPTVPAAGRYQIYARWPRLAADEGSTATYTVTHAGGATPVTVDQRHHGGEWQPLGTFDLTPGQNHRVTLSDLADAAPTPPPDPNAGPSGAETIIDDNAPTVTRIGRWTGTGYWHYSASGSGADRFQWPAPAAAGTYAVYARWAALSGRATDAPYTIHHAGGTTVRRFNQQIDHYVWKLLGTYQLDPAAGHFVELSDDANWWYVTADQIRYVQQPSPLPGAIIVDNDDPGASTAGAWVTTSHVNTGGFWGPNWQHSAFGTGADTFTWTPAITTAGRYHVYARWSSHANRATDAPYTVHHQYGPTVVRVNQEIDGGRWNLLGTFEMVPGANHRVVLSDDANEYVIADAVMFVPDTTSRVVAADAIRLVANTAEDPLFVHADHLGTPRKMTDSAQTIVWDHVTRPFGETFSLLGVFENNRRFPGQYFDSETELHYNYFRDYDPALGRYMQSDPIGLWGGLNTYAYVQGNPILYADPNGLARRDGKFRWRECVAAEWKECEAICAPDSVESCRRGQRFTVRLVGLLDKMGVWEWVDKDLSCNCFRRDSPVCRVP